MLRVDFSSVEMPGKIAMRVLPCCLGHLVFFRTRDHRSLFVSPRLQTAKSIIDDGWMVAARRAISVLRDAKAIFSMPIRCSQSRFIAGQTNVATSTAGRSTISILAA
jgi:hypothetical protein